MVEANGVVAGISLAVFCALAIAALGAVVGYSMAEFAESPEGITDCKYLEYAKFSHDFIYLGNASGPSDDWYDIREALEEKDWTIDEEETSPSRIIAYCGNQP